MRNIGKGWITITVPKNTTQEEIKEIREIFKADKNYQDYKLNIIISGNEKFKENLKNFIKAGLLA